MWERAWKAGVREKDSASQAGLEEGDEEVTAEGVLEAREEEGHFSLEPPERNAILLTPWASRPEIYLGLLTCSF